MTRLLGVLLLLLTLIQASFAAAGSTNFSSILPTVHLPNNSSLPPQSIQTIAVGTKHRLWLGGKQGVYWYDGNTIFEYNKRLQAKTGGKPSKVTTLFSKGEYIYFNWQNNLVRLNVIDHSLYQPSLAGWTPYKQPSQSAPSTWCVSGDSAWSASPVPGDDNLAINQINWGSGKILLKLKMDITSSAYQKNFSCSDNYLIWANKQINGRLFIYSTKSNTPSTRAIDNGPETDDEFANSSIADNRWYVYISKNQLRLLDLWSNSTNSQNIPPQGVVAEQAKVVRIFPGKADDERIIAFDDGYLSYFKLGDRSLVLSDPDPALPSHSAQIIFASIITIENESWLLSTNTEQISLNALNRNKADSFVASGKLANDSAKSLQFCQSGDGKIWRLSDQQRVAFLQPLPSPLGLLNGATKSYAPIYASDGGYREIYCSKDNEFLAISDNSVYRLSEDNGTIRSELLFTQSPESLPISIYYADSAQLIFSDNKTIYWYDKIAKKISNHVEIPLKKSTQIRISVYENSEIWIADLATARVSYYEIERQQWISPDVRKTFNPNNQLINIQSVKDDKAILAYANGEIYYVSVFTNQNGTMITDLKKIIAAGDALSYHFSKADTTGNFWALSERGIERIDQYQKLRYQLQLKDGAMFNYYNANDCDKSSGETLFFCADNGWTSVDINDQTYAKNAVPPPEITNVNLANQSIFAEPNQQSYYLPEQPGAINIILSSPQYGTRQIIYRTRLDDSKNWNVLTNSNQLTLDRLDSGHHKLMAQASLDGHNWSSANTFILEVKRPWYLSHLAYFLYFLILFVIASLVFMQVYIRRQKTFRDSKNHKRVHLALQCSQDFILEMDLHNNCIVHTKATAGSTDLESASVKLTDYLQDIHPLERGQYQHGLDLCEEGTANSFSMEYRRSCDGQWIWYYDNANLVINLKNKQGEHLLVGTTRNINNQKLIEQDLRRLANEDRLTRLPNRTGYIERVKQALADANTHKSQVALFFIDLDRFKTINDTMGHHFGDRVLTVVAESMLRIIGAFPNCTLARIGGDEFTIVMHQANDNEIKKTAEALLSLSNVNHAIGGLDISLSLSIGVAIFPRHASNTEDLMKNADAAMYDAKYSGRNTWCMFDSKNSRSLTERMHMEIALRKACAEKSFELHFQPKIKLDTNRCHGAEALLRWVEDKWVGADIEEVVNVLETSGLIHEVGKWVFEEAASSYMNWHTKSEAPPRIAVNVSVLQIKKGYLKDILHNSMAQYDVSTSHVDIELTESALLHYDSQVITELERIRQTGAHVLIDDFGKGFSSLCYLRDLPVDGLKIDRSFLERIDLDERSSALCSSIINMAHSLGIYVVAEGVERVAQDRLLRSMGCDYAQGFFYARAMTLPEFIRWLPRFHSGSNNRGIEAIAS